MRDERRRLSGYWAMLHINSLIKERICPALYAVIINIPQKLRDLKIIYG